MTSHSRSTALLLAGSLLVAGGASASPGALGGSLSQLVARWERGDPNLSQFLALHLANRAGEPVVMLRVEEGTTLHQVLPELSAIGFRLTSTSSLEAGLAEGYLPLGSARSAAAVPGVRNLRAQLKPQKNAGAVQSQAVALQKADLAQARGFDGRGTRVGALSDSFDACPPFDPATGGG